MQILQFSKFYPPVQGGIETVALELTEGLNARGVRTDVLCADLGRRTVVERRDGYTIERAGSLGKLLSTSMSPALVRRFLGSHSNYDIVNIHLPNPMSNLALWLARSKARIVVHWHSDIVNQPRALRLYLPLQDWLLRRADAIIATSAAYAEHSPWLQPFLDKVHIVPLGLRVRASRPDQERIHGMADSIRRRHGGRPLVFALGRMAAYKGFETLIEAAGRMRHDAHVIVGGSGELLDEHRRNVRTSKLGHRIRFAGEMSDDEVRAHMAAADVFCLPSRSRAEAFGMVLLEAMAASLPIVASDIPGSGVSWVNVEGETGYNVRIADSDALAGAIDALLEDPTRARRMGLAGRSRLDAVFNEQRMIDETLAVYRRTGLHF